MKHQQKYLSRYSSYPTNERRFYNSQLRKFEIKSLDFLVNETQGLVPTSQQELSKQLVAELSKTNQSWGQHVFWCPVPLLTPSAHLKHSLSNLYTGERISKNFKILSSLLRLANCRNVCWINFRSVLACVVKCLKVDYFRSHQWRRILRVLVT